MAEKVSVGTNGGRREGAGRKKGIPNKRSKETAEKVALTGITPLDYMLSVMRKPYPRRATVAQKIAIDAQRFDAARAAAPYVHSKLSSIEVAGTGRDGAILFQITATDAAL